MVWDEVCSIEETAKEEFVYDFAVKHPDHNFIANNFVVSNCGVRLVKTSLRYEDVKDKIEELVIKLFNFVPSGLGSKGEIRASEKKKNR